MKTEEDQKRTIPRQRNSNGQWKKNPKEAWFCPTHKRWMVVVTGHPLFPGKKYVHRARKVMAEYLGRELLPSEIIHHIDGDRTNDDIENLEITTRRGHRLEHQQDLEAGWTAEKWRAHRRKRWNRD